MKKTAPLERELRFKIPQDLPFIGKFSDPVDLLKACKPIEMFFRDEEIKDDEEDSAPVVKDAEYYRKKKNRKRFYKKKQQLVLQDSNPNSSDRVQFDGKPEPTVVDSTYQGEEAPFKYVVMQFVKADNTVNVIPVESIFSFHKHSNIKDQSLTEVQERMEQHAQQQKNKLMQYHQIVNKRMSALGDKESDDPAADKEYVGGFDASSLFGMLGKNSKGRGGAGNVSTFSSQLDENGVEIDQLREYSDYKGDYR